jgi:hypothetical protein
VRDGNVEAYDEPPAQEAPPADAAVAASAAAGTQSAAAPLQPAMTRSHPALPGPGTTPSLGGPAPRRRTGLVYTTVALVAVVAVVAVVAIAGGPGAGSRRPPVDLAAFVMRSAQKTLAQQTADLTVNGTVDVDGDEATLHGSGQADFATNASSINVNTSFSGHTLAESEIETSQHLYLQVTVDGQSMSQLLGGRHWLEIPLAAQPTQIGQQDGAAASLQLLEEQGARVLPMGAQDIGGLTCDEYSVTPTRQAMLAAAQREWVKLGLSRSATAAAQQELNNVSPPTMTIWFDPGSQLACQIDVYLQLSTGASAGSGSGPATDSVQTLVTFTHYGVPVTITPPAQSDTVSF